MKGLLRHIIRFVVLTMSLLCIFPAHGQISAEQTRTIGLDLLASEDYMLAIQYFNKAINAKPYLSEPYYLRGSAKMMLGDYTGAINDCTEALALNSYKQDAYRIRGISHLYLHHDSLALADFEYGLQQAPSDRIFLFYKGLSESRLGNQTKAAQTFATLQKLYPRFYQAYTAQAQNALTMKDTLSAMTCLQQAMAADKYNQTACVMLAQLSLNKQEWNQAESLLNHALQMNPLNDALYVNRGVARYALGHIGEGRADMITALDINPDNKVASHNLEKMHSPHKYKGQLPSSIEIIISDMPDGTTRRLSSGYAEEPQHTSPIGMFALTFTHPYNDIRPVTYTYPELQFFNTAHKFPSGIYISPTADATPDAEQAVALFAYAENLNSDTMSAEQYLGRAVAYSMLKNYDSALADLDKIIAEAPSLITPLIQRAFVRIAKARAHKLTHSIFKEGSAAESEIMLKEAYSRATEDLQQALAKDPQMTYAWYNLGVLYQAMGNDNEALKAYSKAILLNDSFAQAYFNRGLLLLGSNHLQEAAIDLSHAGELGIPAAYQALKYSEKKLNRN